MWPQLLLPCTLHHSHSQSCEAMYTFRHLWDFTRDVPTAGRLVTASSQLHLASFSSFRSPPSGRLPWILPISNRLRLSSPSPVMELVMSCLVVPLFACQSLPLLRKFLERKAWNLLCWCLVDACHIVALKYLLDERGNLVVRFLWFMVFIMQY